MATNASHSQLTRNHKSPPLAETTARLLGVPVRDEEYPGGKRRDSRRMILQNGEAVIATRRGSQARMARETQVLTALNKHQGHAPRLLAHDGQRILVQSELEGYRLSEKFHRADEQGYRMLMSASLESLAQLHRAGSAEGLDTLLPTIGNSEAWINELIQRPAIIGKFFGIRPKRPDIAGLKTLLKVQQPRFVKWDARPGNAMVGFDNKVSWFDWEHAASRNRLDDMAWIMGDEFIPDHPAAEQEIIDSYLPLFADQMDETDARHYLMAYGSLHVTVRLGLIFKSKKDGGWWDANTCIQGDKVGVTQEFAINLCKRGARWSARNPYTESLSPWFERMETYTRSLD